MDESAVRDLVHRHVAWGVCPGARVLLDDAIADAGGDVAAVGRYLAARGGQRVEPATRRDAGPARPYWLLPDALLTRA